MQFLRMCGKNSMKAKTTSENMHLAKPLNFTDWRHTLSSKLGGSDAYSVASIKHYCV